MRSSSSARSASARFSVFSGGEKFYDAWHALGKLADAEAIPTYRLVTHPRRRESIGARAGGREGRRRGRRRQRRTLIQTSRACATLPAVTPNTAMSERDEPLR